ncbi:MAG TPA: PKD domain-containing protein [Solirubrobacteraceae bacterium]|nr:PKD domain-containing protein [Solirubrobacteraceae bacterium]
MALAASAALSILVTASAGADASAPLVQATIYPAGGGTQVDSVSQAQLESNPSQCPTYSGGSTMTEYGRQGQVTVPLSSSTTWTLSTILRCLQTPVDRAAVTGVTVIGDDGAPLTAPNSQLTPADLATPSDFQDTAESPVVQAAGSTDQYDRPWRGGPDLNYLDETQTTPIAIEVFEGPALTVSASASATSVTAGSTITFSAAVTGNNGSALAYNWSFGGGAASSAQASPQVRFATAGVWTVSLEVRSANGGGGGAQLSVTVNPPGSTTTPTSTGPVTTGPDKSKGPKPGGKPTKQKQSGTRNNGNTHGKGTQTTSTTSQTTTTQTTTTQSTTTPAAGSSGGSLGGSSGAAAGPAANPPQSTTTHHKAPAAPSHQTTTTPAPAPTGTLVRGQLISDVIPLPADRSPLVHLVPGSAAGAPARQAPEGPSWWPIAGAALAILALLGLGAWRELGRPRWWPALPLGH